MDLFNLDAAGVAVIGAIPATGSCGPASAEFTASVVLPGAPRIVRVEATPARGCATSSSS